MTVVKAEFAQPRGRWSLAPTMSASSASPTTIGSRSVEPETLDGLSPDSPSAQASRRDLRIINRLQGNRFWIERVLRRYHRPGEPVLEIGAGTGELGRALRAIVPDVAGLDRIRRPRNWTQPAPWFETDVLDFTGWADFPIVIGNLFFHHFDDAGLSRLGAQLNPHTRIIIASEPLRARRTTKLFSLLCPLIGAHPVTRHDGRISITAGFRHDELPRLLQLDPKMWRWRVQETWLGCSRMVAERTT